MPCRFYHWSNWMLSLLPDFHATKPSGRFQRLRLKSCWLQQCRTNWSTEDHLGFSAFLGICEPCGSSEANNWTCKSTGNVMVLPNMSCWKEHETILFRYRGTFSPQLHAFGYEGRAGLHDPLCLSFAKWNCIMSHFACTPFLTQTLIWLASGPPSLIQRIATFSQHVWRVVAQ